MSTKIILTVEGGGPNEQSAFWADVAERWMWREDRVAQETSKR